MDYESLDHLSRRFAAAVLTKFPEWRALLRVVGETATAQAIEVQVPQEHGGRHLHMSTENGEITIGFDEWHTHIGPFLGLDEDECVSTALGMAEAFLAEETVVTVAHRKGRWIGSSLEYVAAPSEPETNAMTRVFFGKLTHDRVIARE